MFPEMNEVPVVLLKTFRFDDLKKATRNFSEDLLLGEGGFGKVFIGWVDQNTLAPTKQGFGIGVAVKRLRKESVQGFQEWQTEVNILGQLAHPNIIRLLGYCRDKTEHLLVYEYMPNKSFDRFLFSDTAERLSWRTRLLIMTGVAHGLTYLHSRNIISRSLKCSDILLEEDFNAKLGDFGLMKYGVEIEDTHVTTMVMGTFGYMAPEYILTGRLTMKCDIYSFGVVLLESMSGRRAFDHKQPAEKKDLVEWASQMKLNGENINKLMDPIIEDHYPPQDAFECVSLALRCVEKKPKDRPSSEEVMQSLEQIYARSSQVT